MQTSPLVLTPGEQGGIAPEITAKAWQSLHPEPASCFFLISDLHAFSARVQQSGVTVPVQAIATPEEAAAVFPMALPILHRPLPSQPEAGKFSIKAAPWVIAAIDGAVQLCLDGKAAAMVTCPIQKESLYAAGFTFQGHTDYLAHLARVRGFAATEVMMLVGGGLRAVPVTVHIALKNVAQALTAAAIEAQALVVHEALKNNFAIARPRLAVTGLNPHAGENGSMGREEIDIITPAIQRLRERGLDVQGPLPADTAFFPQARQNYDAIVCMYHDQALIPVKALDFHGGVNVTLGLPFIRTSPDHGTALSLAGTGKADPSSLIAAMRLARDMADNARR